MKPWSIARWLANKISTISTEPAYWLENTGCGTKWVEEWSELLGSEGTSSKWVFDVEIDKF
jgi:hypothetical protein